MEAIHNDSDCANRDEVKSFISSLLSKAREEGHHAGYAGGLQKDFCEAREGAKAERARIINLVEGMKRSLLEDMAYSGGGGKKYLSFQRLSDTHYLSHNRALCDLIIKLKEDI